MTTNDKVELDEQFRRLVSNYYSTIDCVSGTGARGQSYVDKAYTNIEEFCQFHPEYKDKLAGVKKHRVDNDGYGGFLGAAAAIHRSIGRY